MVIQQELYVCVKVVSDLEKVGHPCFNGMENNIAFT